MLGTEPERQFINLKPRSCMHITYFSNLSFELEYKGNVLSILKFQMSSELYLASKCSLALTTVFFNVDHLKAL
jgi:hypothetical protein